MKLVICILFLIGSTTLLIACLSTDFSSSKKNEENVNED